MRKSVSVPGARTVGCAEQAAIAASAGYSIEALDLLRRVIEERDTYLSFTTTPA